MDGSRIGAKRLIIVTIIGATAVIIADRCGIINKLVRIL